MSMRQLAGEPVPFYIADFQRLVSCVLNNSNL